MDIVQTTEELLKKSENVETDKEKAFVFNEFMQQIIDGELNQYGEAEKSQFSKINSLILNNKYKKKDIFDILKCVPSKIAGIILDKLGIDDDRYKNWSIEMSKLYLKDFIENMTKPLSSHLCKKFSIISRPFTIDELCCVCASKNIDLITIDKIEKTDDLIDAIKHANLVLKKRARQNFDYEFMQENTIKYLNWIYCELEKLIGDKQELTI